METDDFYNAIFAFGESEEYAQQFARMGIESKNPIIGLGPAFAVIVCTIFIAIMVKILNLCASRCSRLKSLLDKINSKLYWNSTLRFLLETYIEMAIACLVKV